LSKSVLFEADWRLKADPLAERDEIFAPRIALLTEALNSSGNHPLTILDAACASGSFAAFFREKYHRVVPCDISFTALTLTRRHHLVGDGAACTVEALPLKDATFDAVWFGESLALLENVHAALSEFNRVLKPGGWLALTTPYYGRLKSLAIVLFRFDRHFYPEDYRIRHFSRSSLTRVLKHNGFEVSRWKGIGRFAGFWQTQYALSYKVATPRPKPSWHPPGSDYPDASPLDATEYFALKNAGSCEKPEEREEGHLNLRQQRTSQEEERKRHT
jgi:SAM-dependent methyltransferase